MFSINNLSKYRIELMGFSMLWIMFFHSSIVIPNTWFYLKLFKLSGYAGVDIFFLLSGIGIAFSLSKNPNYSTYMGRRISRIIPTFWTSIALYDLKIIYFNQINFIEMAAPFFGLYFLLYGKLTFWFVPAIFICYLLAPFFYFLFKHYQGWTVLLTMLSLFFIISYMIIGTQFSYFLIMTIRMPLFFFGIYLGIFILKGGTSILINNIYFHLLLFILAVFSLYQMFMLVPSNVRWSTGIWWYPTLLLAFPLSMILSYFLTKMDKTTSIISTFLTPFGIYSLEIYLIHGLIYDIGALTPFKYYSWNIYRVPEYIVYITISLILSILMRFFITKISQYFFKTA